MVNYLYNTIYLMRIRIAHPHPVLIASTGDDGKSYLVASDLHIGFEHELAEKGILLDDDYVDEILDELIRIARNEHCNAMILLGDVKSSVKGISREEWKNVPAFMSELARHVDELYVVPGNHDSYLTRLLPDSVRVVSSRGMIIDDILFIHGHAAPRIKGMGVRRMVMGHMHPTLTSREGNILNGERVWMILKIRQDEHCYDDGMLDVIVMPSFNRYTASMHYNRHYGRRHGLTSPILRKAVSSKGIIRAVVLTLDGSIVGDENTLYDYFV